MQDSDDQIKKPQTRSRTLLQANFFDSEERLRRLDQLGEPPIAINDVVDWSVFRPILNKGLRKARSKVRARVEHVFHSHCDEREDFIFFEVPTC